MSTSLWAHAADPAEAIDDDFVISPTSALRFISLSLRRTISTPRDTRLARLEFGTYYKVVCKSTFCELINCTASLNLSLNICLGKAAM
jgi:hypothetical protein